MYTHGVSVKLRLVSQKRNWLKSKRVIGKKKKTLELGPVLKQ